MAGGLTNIRRRNQRLEEAFAAARSARTGKSATSRPGPKIGAKTRVKPTSRQGLRAQPAKRMQTNLPITRPTNRPQSISGGNRRQQQINDIERRIKELGG